MALWIHVCMYQIVHFKYMCTQLYPNNSVKNLSLENCCYYYSLIRQCGPLSTLSCLKPVFLVRLVVYSISVHWCLVVQFSLCISFLIPGYKTSPRQLPSSSYFLHGKHSPWPAIGDSSYSVIVAAVAASHCNQMPVFRFLRSKSDKTSPESLSWARSLFGILLYAINKTFLNSVNLKIYTLL